MIALVRFRSLAALFIALLGAAALPTAYGLENFNSKLDIDLTPNVHNTVYNWTVEGVDHLEEFSNWYRVGGGAEISVSTLTVTSATPTNTVDTGAPDQLVVVYDDLQSRFTIEVTYAVLGGLVGSGYSQMGECVTITNHLTGPLNFHFFEYMNLDLDATPGDDVATRMTAARLEQHDVVGGTTFNVAYGSSSHHEIAYHPTLLNAFTIGGATTLNDMPAGFATPTGPQIGPPGDMEWALQWDMVLAPAGSPGDAFSICKDCELQMLVPEPAGCGLAMIGTIAGMAAGRLRGRRRKDQDAVTRIP